MTSMICCILFLSLSVFFLINAEDVSLCEKINDMQVNEDNSESKLERIRAFCQATRASEKGSDGEHTDFVPNFDLTQIDSENDANQILKRFRRGRGGGGGGRGGGGRFGGGSRFSGGRFRSSSGGSRFFSRSSSRISSSRSGGSFRVRNSIRTFMRRPSSTGTGSGGSKTGFSNKIRKITNIGGISRFSQSGGATGSGSGVWVRSAKSFLPHAARFGKRYYQRRKYNQGFYGGMGSAVGYRAGSRMYYHPYGYGYYHHNYGYPPANNTPPAKIDGKTPMVFYCIQEDLNTTLVNQTLDANGYGTCNISGKLVQCPIEIECQMSDADSCCEDEQGKPYCCGGPIPLEYLSHAGGYGDDWEDAAESINTTLNMLTTFSVILATICLTVWQRRNG